MVVQPGLCGTWSETLKAGFKIRGNCIPCGNTVTLKSYLEIMVFSSIKTRKETLKIVY